MQTIKRISLISLVVLGLSACTTVREYGFFKDETQSYRKVRPVESTVVIPQNLSSKNVQDYYEVPQPAAEAGSGEPPLTPPGSQIAQPSARPSGMSQIDRIRNAESAKIQGHTSPAANAPKPVGVQFPQAWVKVGHILQAANYKVVEKDNSLGTYYVVDTTGTGGKVKKDAPIYQVHLKAAGNGTLVTVNPSNAGLQRKLNSSLND